MLSVILFAVCIGLSSQQMPSHQDILAMIDAGFRQFDTNHDGTLSEGELQNVAFAEDTDGDGKISLAEYMAYTHQTVAQAKPMFDAFDTDGTGFLTINHLDQFLALMDQNGDGEVHLKEYEHYQFKLITCVYGDHGHTHGHATTCLLQ